MSVQGDLTRLRDILVHLAEYPECGKICGYSGQQVKWFLEGLDRAIARYKAEASRVRKYYP